MISASKQIFGQPLRSVLLRNDESHPIPSIVEMCFNYLLTRGIYQFDIMIFLGLDISDLFEKSGENIVVQSYKHVLDSGID